MITFYFPFFRVCKILLTVLLKRLWLWVFPWVASVPFSSTSVSTDNSAHFWALMKSLDTEWQPENLRVFSLAFVLTLFYINPPKLKNVFPSSFWASWTVTQCWVFHQGHLNWTCLENLNEKWIIQERSFSHESGSELSVCGESGKSFHLWRLLLHPPSTKSAFIHILTGQSKVQTSWLLIVNWPLVVPEFSVPNLR